jgi:hypothetical protein
MTIDIKKLMMLLLAVSSLVACSQKSEDREARAMDFALGVNGTSPTCSTGQEGIGHIYESGSASGIDGTAASFEQRVKGLISATADPQLFGVISGTGDGIQNGVTIEGRLRYDGSGGVLLDQSNMIITIKDSFVGQLDSAKKLIPAYPINFHAATAGSVNLQTREFTLQFKDAYGEITLNGVINTKVVTGTVSYQNYKNVTGAPPSAGVLGAFSIATCGWVN